MRGAFSKIKVLKKDRQMRPGGTISDGWTTASTRRCWAVAARAEFARLNFDFYLFCLTRAVILDNQHGLLKKFDTVRAAKTLSAAKP